MRPANRGRFASVCSVINRSLFPEFTTAWFPVMTEKTELDPLSPNLARARGGSPSTGTARTGDADAPASPTIFTRFPPEHFDCVRFVLPPMFRAEQDKYRPDWDKIRDTPGQNLATLGQNFVLIRRRRFTKSEQHVGAEPVCLTAERRSTRSRLQWIPIYILLSGKALAAGN
ncbi:hypothetical protein Pan153_35070 [Gimesia panareensis]|uniref:Uncharacterized protein n=1 Tax=Gimesia panareensis TaxID=2527978 RepID=A0A518FR74_9PLAN|nr:hypothetical protein Pan153_35070 [Gimesia panareensis]